MNKDKFFTKEKLAELYQWMNPIDFFNKNGDWTLIFELAKNKKGDKVFSRIDETGYQFAETNNLEHNTVTHRFVDGFIVQEVQDVYKRFPEGHTFTLFEALTVYRFNDCYKDALNYIEYRVMKAKMKYIRVGTDYYKIITKKNRYGVDVQKLKIWKKDEIRQDHGKEILKEIPLFEDFTLVPNNKNYQEFLNNCYNLYSKFPHESVNCTDKTKFPNIDLLMNHIFGDQVNLGYKYLKIMYEYPQQILPILVLASTERQTGKTTFLNFLEILFADNYVNISPNDLVSDFNHLYATKNVIAIDETVIEKSSSVEKLKSISTQKTMTVNTKFVSQYVVPFYGKIIMATNKETDFMRIDDEEIRFWVRKINVISKKNTNIEQDIAKEIPCFLGYLESLPEIDFSKSRMVFTEEEIRTENLQKIQKESKSGLYKELKELLTDYFSNQTASFMHAIPIDIKKRWFDHNNQISTAYIAKVLKDEMKIPQVEKRGRYYPIDNYSNEKIGQYFIFERNHFISDDEVEVEVEAPSEVPF